MTHFGLTPFTRFRTPHGFEPSRIVDLLDTQSASDINNQPPYNIEKIDDTHYRLTLAIAGFTEDDIAIETLGEQLTIRGNTAKNKQQHDKSYIYRGFGQKSFERRFELAENITVGEARLTDGLLSIDFEREIPESQQVQQVPIVKK